MKKYYRWREDLVWEKKLLREIVRKNNAGYVQNPNTGQFELTDLGANSVDTFVGDMNKHE